MVANYVRFIRQKAATAEGRNMLLSLLGATFPIGKLLAKSGLKPWIVFLNDGNTKSVRWNRHFFAFLGVFEGAPPSVPNWPFNVPNWFFSTPLVVPTAFWGGFFALAITNFLTHSLAKMQLSNPPSAFGLKVDLRYDQNTDFVAALPKTFPLSRGTQIGHTMF